MTRMSHFVTFVRNRALSPLLSLLLRTGDSGLNNVVFGTGFSEDILNKCVILVRRPEETPREARFLEEGVRK